MSRRTRTRRARKIEGDGPIDIRHDGADVRCVQARSEADALRGLGHCRGVDRGMQLVVTPIIGRGRAAETLDGGEEMQAIDRFSAGSWAPTAASGRRSSRPGSR